MRCALVEMNLVDKVMALKRVAPEFYDNLAVCESWVGVIWDYIVRPEVGPYNRVKRNPPSGGSGEADVPTIAAVRKAGGKDE